MKVTNEEFSTSKNLVIVANIAAATIRAWLIKNEIEVVYFTGQKSVKDFDIYSEVIRVIEGVQRMDTEDSESHNQ